MFYYFNILHNYIRILSCVHQVYRNIREASNNNSAYYTIEKPTVSLDLSRNYITFPFIGSARVGPTPSPRFRILNKLIRLRFRFVLLEMEGFFFSSPRDADAAAAARERWTVLISFSDLEGRGDCVEIVIKKTGASRGSAGAKGVRK